MGEANLGQIQRLALMALMRYFQINLMLYRPLNRPPRLRTRISDFSENDYWNLYRMKRGLRFGNNCALENGARMTRDEIFLRGLYELESGEDLHNISVNVFGRDHNTAFQSHVLSINFLHCLPLFSLFLSYDSIVFVLLTCLFFF